MSHALFYTYDHFKKAVDSDTSKVNKKVVNNLCLLFGASVVLKNISPIIEGGFIRP